MIWAAPLLLADVTIGFTGLTAFVPGKQRSYHVVLVDAREERQYETHTVPVHVPFVMVPRAVTVSAQSKAVSEVDCTDRAAWRCFELVKTSYWVEAGEPRSVKVHRSFRDHVASIARLYRPAGEVNSRHAKGKGVAGAFQFRNGVLKAPAGGSHCTVRVEDEADPNVPIAEWADLELGNVSEVDFCTKRDACGGDTLALKLEFPAGDHRIWIKNLPLSSGSAGGGTTHPSGHGDPAHFGLFYSLLDDDVDPDEELKPPLPTCIGHAGPAAMAHPGVAGVDVGLTTVDSTVCPPSQFP